MYIYIHTYIYRYLISNAIRGNWEIEQGTDQPFQGHKPITLRIPGFQELDLGYRLVNPKRIDLTGPTEEIEEPGGQGDNENWESNDSWEAWAQGAEEWLLKNTTLIKHNTGAEDKKISWKTEPSQRHNCSKTEWDKMLKADRPKGECNK